MTTTPDTDNGYYRIANEIGEALARTDLSGGARRILDVIMRRTWGYNKKADWIALSQFEDATGMTRKSVCRLIKEIEDRGVIVSKRTLGRTEYGINKHFSQWKASVQTDTTSVQNGNHLVSKRTHTKDNLTKDNRVTNVTPAHRGRVKQPPAAAGNVDNDKKTPTVPKHLEPLAMYALLFDVKYPSREEWSVFIKRNARVSTMLSKLPLQTLAGAMVLAEDHWAKKRDYEMRLETVHKFVENVGKDQIPPHLVTRREDLLALFEKGKLHVFLPTPAHV